MAHEYPAIPTEQHHQILQEQILQDRKYIQVTGGHERPKAIILSGQPGAGKGGLVRTALSEMGGNAAVIDPDELRSAHPDIHRLRREKPYTWSGETHSDASRWAQELRADAVAQRKHLVIDTTMPRADVIKELKAQGYEVEVRAIATHRLESEVGVDNRFTSDLDRRGYGRHVQQEVRSAVYDKLPGALDDVAKQTGVPIQIYDREGRLHFDSRTSQGKSFSLQDAFSSLWRLDLGSITRPLSSPGRALKIARNARLTPARLTELQHAADAQRKWHRELPDRLQQGMPPHTTLDRTH